MKKSIFIFHLSYFILLSALCASAQWTPPTSTTNTTAATKADIAALQSVDATSSSRLDTLEGQTNDWNTAYSWGDHAGLYPTISAWNATNSEIYTAIAAATPGGYDAVSNLAVNAVQKNAPVTLTNDTVWSGWTTDGSLSGTNIFLLSGQTLVSPLLTNGVSSYEIASSSDQGGTDASAQLLVGTNVVQNPYTGSDAQLKITAGATMPGATPGITISAINIVGYADPAEAAQPKYVSGLRRIDAATDPADLTPKSYVDAVDAADRTAASAALSAYDADATKTLRGASLRLGNMWVISPADSTGTRFIVSGGEISGDGELVGTTNEFVISKNDYPLLEFTSGASGLHVASHALADDGGTNILVTLNISTNGVTSAPFAEWSESITAPEWHRVATYTQETYPTASAGTYTLQFSVPDSGVMYFRAMQPEGQSVARVKTDVLIVDGVISNAAFQTMENTLAGSSNLWNSVAGKVDTIILNGETNTATGGVVDLGTIESGASLLAVPTDTDKLALTGLSFGQQVIITNEGYRVEMYIGGDATTNSNWTVIKRGKVKVYYTLDYGAPVKVVFDGVDCPDGETTFVGEYEVGSMLYASASGFSNLFISYAPFGIKVDGASLFSGMASGPIFETYVRPADANTGYYLIANELPIRTTSVEFYGEGT